MSVGQTLVHLAEEEEFTQVHVSAGCKGNDSVNRNVLREAVSTQTLGSVNCKWSVSQQVRTWAEAR